MRPLRVLSMLAALGTLGYMAVRWVRRRGVTRIPVEEIK